MSCLTSSVVFVGSVRADAGPRCSSTFPASPPTCPQSVAASDSWAGVHLCYDPGMKSAIQEILNALNDAGVRYLVVGGVAVVLHGYLRTTADLDLVIQLRPDNIVKALVSLASVGYRPRLPVKPEQLADASTRASWIRDKGMLVFPLYSDHHPILGVDIFVREPFDFDSVYGRALRVPLDRATAPVISIEDLIQMKLSAARPRDIEDVEALRTLRDGGKEDDV